MTNADKTAQPVADFSYEAAHNSAGLPTSIAVFADRPAMRGQIVADLVGAGFRAAECGTIAALLDEQVKVLGDVVLIDCPEVDAKTLAALARLDMRVAQSGSQLIVSTSLDALDDVFAVLDQSEVQILVQPSRAERVVAVGRGLSSVPNSRVREMTEEDRIALLKLSQQVETIAKELDRISSDDIASDHQRLSDFKRDWRGPEQQAQPLRKAAGRGVSAPLPDPRLVRQIISNRQTRTRFFDAELFSDPAWDMLLDLTAAHAEHRRVSVTSLCIAAGVPATTALRWVRQMVDSGIFVRVADSTDKRRAFIALSEGTTDAMASYFAAIDAPVTLAA